MRMPVYDVRARILAALHEALGSRTFVGRPPGSSAPAGPAGLAAPAKIRRAVRETSKQADQLTSWASSRAWATSSAGPNPDDQRSRRVHLTPRGLEVA